MSATRPDDTDPYLDPAPVGPEDGDPGGHIGPGDLAPDEERLLAALERDAAVLQADPVADFVEQVRAERESGALTAPADDAGGADDDGLTPLFTAPDVE